MSDQNFEELKIRVAKLEKIVTSLVESRAYRHQLAEYGSPPDPIEVQLADITGKPLYKAPEKPEKPQYHTECVIL